MFLQFDGLSDAVYGHIRKAALLSIKSAAIERCAEYGLGVVLVPTLIPGVNTGELGAIIAHAARLGPAVRGVHFQPVSYFGRYPGRPSDADRITLPEVVRAIEQQTGGAIAGLGPQATLGREPVLLLQRELRPDAGGGAERREGHPDARSRAASRRCCGDSTRGDEVRRAREYVARRWAHPEACGTGGTGCCTGSASETLNRIIAEAAKSSFCISGMAFQDVWNVNLARLRECFLHVVSPDGRVVPFCAYNLTSAAGLALHRRGAV